jgi:hypothetical protein
MDATAGNQDAGPLPEGGTGTATGPQSFPIKWAWMDPSQPADECAANAVSGKGFAATAIDLFENDLSSLACSDGGLGNGGTGSLINIEIATQQYASQMMPFTQALAPGTYVIGNEGEDDPDLCMLPSGSTAILQILTFGQDDAQWTAISGTVTIDTVGPTSIAGSFAVLLGGPFGQYEGGTPPSLSGAFNASTCP